MIRLIASSLLVALSSSSFCGDSAIPFSFKVRPDGQPILGCARPTCFGWAPSGKPATNTGSFYKINDHADGFLRPWPEAIPPFAPNDARYYQPQTAVCDAGYTSSACASAAHQWVGGVAPSINVTIYPTMLQCCTFLGLQRSEDRGRSSLQAGKMALGGEVLDENGNQLGFDYISNVAKIVYTNGTIQYDVSVRRMPCDKYPALEKKEFKKLAKHP